MTTGVVATPPILSFLLNNGQLAVNGSILTQVGGVNAATFSDSGLTTPLPNPIPLNSRGEISDATGNSKQLFLTPNTVYTFTLFDGPNGTGNQIWQAAYVNGVQLTAAAAAALLNTLTNVAVLNSLVQTAAEIAAGVTPSNYSYQPGDIRRYGAVCDGSTDDSAAVRSALDAVPVGGGFIFFPQNGVCKLASQIFIPQRNTQTSSGQPGLIIEGNNCTLIGPGTGSGATGSGAWTTLASGSIPSAMFETGTGQFSTVAKGGATNFGLGNELGTTLHTNTKIRNLKFTSFGMGLHLFNFVQGTSLENLLFELGYTGVSDDRSFYCNWYNVNTAFQQSGAGAAGYPGFILIDNVNDRAFLGCHAVGALPSSGASIGWLLSGVQGCAWVACSAEQCGKGVQITGQSQALSWHGCYFEVNSVAAFSIESTTNAMTIEDCEFISVAGNQPIAIQAATGAWGTGRLGINDYRTQDGSNNQILLTNGSNTCQVYVSPRQFTRQGSGSNPHTGWTALPTGWNVAAGCRLQYTDFIYNDAIGFTAPIAALSPPTQGNLVAKPYTGTLSGTSGGQIPFCTTSIAGTTLTILTKIPFDANGFGITFDIVAADNVAVRYISGRTFGGTSVFRFDANTMTVTVSNSGGFFQFAIAGFNTSVSLTGGEIRLT